MRRTHGGFTLLEIMVTLVIVAMFSSAVYAMFLRAVVDTRTMQELSAAGRLEQSVLGLIERDLAGCLPSTETLAHFTGEADGEGAARLEFLTAVDARVVGATAAADLVRVAYLTVPNEEIEGVRKLYRRETDTSGEDRYVLLDKRVKEFLLEYYDGTGWRDAWNEATLPRAVRVALVLRRALQAGAQSPATAHDFRAEAVVAIPAGG